MAQIDRSSGRFAVFDHQEQADEVYLRLGSPGSGYEKMFQCTPATPEIEAWAAPLMWQVADPYWLYSHDIQAEFVLAAFGWFAWLAVYPNIFRREGPEGRGWCTPRPTEALPIAQWLARSLQFGEPATEPCVGCLRFVGGVGSGGNTVSTPAQICWKGVALALVLSRLTGTPVLIGGDEQGRCKYPCGSTYPGWTQGLPDWSRMIIASDIESASTVPVPPPQHNVCGRWHALGEEAIAGCLERLSAMVPKRPLGLEEACTFLLEE